MATEAQINANRRNSQKSTGPKTAEGKEAVSQNAFKHGLFVNEAVIRDESQEEYDLHRQELLAEIEPVDVMESIVAERLVNLTWRLERAQRMQNQSIEYLGLRQLDSVTGSNIKTLYRRANEQSWDEPDVAGDHLLLGRLATKDWSYSRVLDRMLLYEQRIENSMYKTMGELKKLQKMRKAEQAYAIEEQSDAESPPAQRRRIGLKKQSQFAPALTDTKPYIGNDYNDTLSVGASGNKANQACPERSGRGQFQRPTASATEGAKNEACRAG